MTKSHPSSPQTHTGGRRPLSGDVLRLVSNLCSARSGTGGAEPSTLGSGRGDRGLRGQWEGSGWGPAVTRCCPEEQLDQSAGVVGRPETLLFYGNTPPARSERAQPLAGTGEAVLFVTSSSRLLLGKAEGASDSHLEDPGGGLWVMTHGSFSFP